MKLAHKWRGGGILSAKIFAALIAVVAMVGVVVPLVHAEPSREIPVTPGANTLKAAVDSAEDGDTLLLRAGSYTSTDGAPVEITKAITIRGVGSNNRVSSDNTTVLVPLVIKLDEPSTDKKVTLENFASSNQSVTADFVFVKVDSAVDLVLNGLRNWGILRSESNGLYGIHDATSLLLTENAKGAHVLVDHTTLDRSGSHYGIWNKATETEINVQNNSKIGGRHAITFDGQDSQNTLTINNSEIVGRYYAYADPDAIEIRGQKGTTITINNSTVEGANTKNNIPGNIFAFLGTKSTSTTVSLNNVSITDGIATREGSTIFNFGSDATPEDENIIKLSGNTTLKYKDGQDIPLANKYNTIPNYSAVGIYNKEANNEAEIKVHAPGEISELKGDLSVEGYNFKGWYKGDSNKAETKIETTDDKTAKAGTNLDAYAKFVKIAKLTIKGIPSEDDQTYNLDQDTVISDAAQISDIKAKLASLKEKKDGEDFQNFIFYQNDKPEEAKTFDNEEELVKETIYADSTIEANHKLTIKINDEDFHLDSGQTLADLKNDPNYETAKEKGNDNGHEFWRFEDAEKGITIEESSDDYTFTENLNLVSKYYVKVTLNVDDKSDQYKVGEGQALKNAIAIDISSQNITEALNGLKDDGANVSSYRKGHFARFENTANQAKVDEETTIDDDITIKPIYFVNITIGDQTYKIDEGSVINDMGLDDFYQDGGKTALENALSNLTAPDGQEIKNYKVDINGEIPSELQNQSIEKSQSYPVDGDAGQARQNIINNHKFYLDSTIYIEAEVTVTIKKADGSDATLTLDAGAKLNALKDDNLATYEKAIYGDDNSRKERFYRLVKMNGDDEGDTFPQDEEIVSNITLKPKYFWTVTLDENGDGNTEDDLVAAVEENTAYDKFIDVDKDDIATASAAETKINSMRQNQDGEDHANKEYLHFEKLVLADDADVPETVSEDITIKGLYHYDVEIATKYVGIGSEESDPAEQLYTVHKDKTLSEEQSGANGSLEALKESASVSDGSRKFHSFVVTSQNGDTADSTEMSEADILNTTHNTHIDITAKVEFKVTVTDQEGKTKDFYVVEGENIASNSELVEAIRQLGQKDGWKVSGYVVDDQPVIDLASIQGTIIDQPTDISANYQIRINIEGDTTEYWIDQNKTLNSSTQQNEIKTALDNLEAAVKAEGLTFKGYMVNGEPKTQIDDVMASTFTQPAEITAVRKLTVTIGDHEFTLEDNDSLSALKEMPEYSEATTKSNRKLIWLKDDDETLIDPNDVTYSFTKSTTLTPIYGIDVVVEGIETPYQLEEDKKLGDILSDAKVKLTQSDKNLVGFTSDDITEVTATWTLSDDYNKDTLTLEPKYTIVVTIVDYQGNLIDEVQLDEGQSLADKSGWDTKVKEKAVNKTYDGLYDSENHKVSPEDISPSANVEYVAKYTVQVSLKDSQGKQNSFTLPEGGTLADLAGEEKTKLAEWQDSSKYVQSDLDLNKVYTENGEVNIRMYKTVTVGEVPHKVIEGTTLQDLLNSGELSNEAPEGQHFVRFVQTEGGEEYKLDSPINDNLTLSPVYGLYITVQTYNPTASVSNASRSVSDKIKETPYEFVLEKELKDGVSMDNINNHSNIKSSLHDGHIRFDYADGNNIPEGTRFTTDTTIRDVYPIKITTADNSKGYELESWQTLGNLEPGVLELLKTSLDGREFSHFADSNNNKIAENEPLFEDLLITPKFYITLTVTPYVGEDAIEGIEPKDFKFGEDQLLSELVKTKEWQDWANNVTATLAANGKPNYYFSHYLSEDGSIINLDEKRYSEDTNLRAVFVYSPVAPSTPTPSTTPDTTENITPKAPDTGVETNDSTAFVVASAITLFVAASALIFEFVQKAHQRK